MTSSSIHLHQTLHGYRDGHELLASSCELDRRARRQLLMLSDLSGDEPSKAFHQYLTGYPVSATSFYALATTWYAPEMQRPGCVWTHTLLIPKHDLHRIGRVSDLLSRFRRPTSGGNWSLYTKPTSVESRGSDCEWDVASGHEAFATEIVDALYSSDATPILIASKSSQEYQALILALWAQLPWRFRSEFSFSTGSLSFRTWENRPFDVQVVPASRWQKVAAGAGRSVAALYEANGLVRAPSSQVGLAHDWARLLSLEIALPDAQFRAQLERWSGMVPAVRSSVKGLLQTSLIVEAVLNGSGSLDDLVTVVAGAFPGDAGAEFAAFLFGGTERGGNERSPLSSVPDEAIVRALVSSASADLLSFDALNIRARVRRYFFPSSDRAFDPSGLRWLCIDSKLADPGRTLRSSLLAEMSVEDLVRVFGEDHELVRRILALSPSHLEQVEVWNQLREFQRICVEVARGCNNIDLLVHAVVRAPHFALGKELVDVLGVDFLGTILTTLNDVLMSDGSVHISKWESALAAAPQQVGAWVRDLSQPLAGGLLEALGALGDGVEMLRCVPPAAVAAALERERGREASSYEHPDVASAALAVALLHDDPVGAPIASQTFERVHSALMQSRLGWSAWRRLEQLLPRTGALFDWDKAERLRRGLADRFVGYPDWPVDCFASALMNPDTRKRTVRYCRSSIAGRELLSRAGLA